MSGITIDQLDYNPWPKKLWKKIATGIWASTLIVIGFIAMLAAWLTDPRKVDIKWASGAFNIVVDSWFGKWMYDRGWRGFTFGLSVLLWTRGSDRAQTWAHERVHVKQFLKYGPLMPFIYGTYTILYGYEDNPLEVEAREKSRVWLLDAIDRQIKNLAATK